MSVGGWTDSGPFYEMAASESTRGRRSRSRAPAFLKTYPQFDGIDIDWEHPVVGRTAARQPARRPQLRAAARRLPQAIGAGKLLTVAVSASPRGIDPLEYADMAAIARLGQRDDLRLPQRRQARRIQLGALQPRRSVEPQAQPARRGAGHPRQGHAARQARRRRAVLRPRLAAASSRRTSGVPAPARCRSAATASSPRRS